MCGRFALSATPQEVRAVFDFIETPNFPPRFNIAPTQPVATVRMIGGGRRFALVRWGLVPGWVKDPASFSLLLNARAETAAQKPSFRAAMRHRRCLIPASGFYEWHRPDGGAKQPYWIRPRDGGVVAFAGLWEEWCDPDGGEIETGTVLTVPSNSAISWIHHRMPAVIAPKDFDTWLDVRSTPYADAHALLTPASEDLFEAIAVSTRVNNARIDDRHLIEPAETVSAGEDAQSQGLVERSDRGSETSSDKQAVTSSAKDEQLDLF